MNSIDEKRDVLPVLMTIRSEQYLDGEEPESMELMTEGVMEVLEDGLRLSYQESELTGLEGTTTSFEIRGPQVILTRTGTVSSHMVFEEGRQHTSLYETPFGELSVDIQTSRLQHNLTERGGLLRLKYSIAIEHAATGRNAFKIHVRRKKQ